MQATYRKTDKRKGRKTENCTKLLAKKPSFELEGRNEQHAFCKLFTPRLTQEDY